MVIRQESVHRFSGLASSGRELFFARRSFIHLFRPAAVLLLTFLLAACGSPLNNPYPAGDKGRNILYTSFTERPKHLDPARAYSSNEYEIIAQIYEPLLQYAYLKRPYQLEPLTAEALPIVTYLDKDLRPLPDNAPEERIAYSEYDIRLRPNILFQPHPAFARNGDGSFRYHALTEGELAKISTITDFAETGARELTAEDYAYQIKRLVHPQLHSPIAEMMKSYIVGLKETGERMAKDFDARPDKSEFFDIRGYTVEGVDIADAHRLKIRLHGKYPQFRFWLAMPFFAPMPWEADAFYAQRGLIEKNITLDWYPVGTGAYMLAENNPNRRMVLLKNPNYHDEFYPAEGEPEDAAKGYLKDAGQKLPFIEKVVFTLEKETIPYWNKFLQGYYDASGIASDNFDQAVQFTGQNDAELTPEMKAKDIHLETAITTTIFYMGFNMLDATVGGLDEAKSKLRQAINIAVDYEEFIDIFINGRGVPALGILPPDIFGHVEGKDGINPYVYDWADGAPRRKNIEAAKKLLAEAGYPNGVDAKTGRPLVLYLDTVARGPDDKSILNWYRKQFAKLGIQLVLRTTDYNQFQQKMLNGNAQIFMWGWNADYPDPENFFFLVYGENAKVGKGGENAANYKNPEFDRLFERMRNMDDGEERFRIIQAMQEILRHDSPWLFGYHPKAFSLHHDWFRNLKPNLMANNGLKYRRIEAEQRELKRAEWNRPIYWPLAAGSGLLVAAIVPAYSTYRRRMRSTAL
ncbi:ABC transporter substrate-binding protein [Methylocaldum sp. 14B]|uniref:ABC transporter substrate-binding protein n=1 Tax=Methylocaldum sp. 14B TaxID=1912213 RepID=UPI00098A93DD|nr:ABC transporter substrate-binding protein [Methylocaldum sp. 14B]